MALAAAVSPTRISATRRHIAPQITSAAQLWSGGYTALGSSSHATAGKRGRAFTWTQVAGAIPMGFVEQSGLGDATATNRARVLAEGRVIEQLAVVGVTAYTDVGKWVFATDDDTFTLTRSTAPSCLPVGIIVDWYSGTSCDVYFLSFGELLAMMANGGISRTMLLGTVTAGATTGNVLTGIPMFCHGAIQSVFGIVAVDATDADVQQDINLEIGGTNVTGGVITWLFSSAFGVKLAGTAVTAANVFHEGDLLDAETVATVAGTTADPGLLNVYMTFDILPGL